jgi:hypothetical protein
MNPLKLGHGTLDSLEKDNYEFGDWEPVGKSTLEAGLDRLASASTSDDRHDGADAGVAKRAVETTATASATTSAAGGEDREDNGEDAEDEDKEYKGRKIDTDAPPEATRGTRGGRISRIHTSVGFCSSACYWGVRAGIR